MSLPTVTEAFIRRNTFDTVFAEGQRYFERGAVRSLIVRGTALEMEVAGTTPPPCQVRCSFDAAGITSSTCSCCLDAGAGSWCEHITAALLAYHRQPERVEERQPLDVLVAALDRYQLHSLLLALAAEDPGLARIIERRLDGAESGSAGGSGERTAQPIPPEAPIAPRRPHSPLRVTGREQYREDDWRTEGESTFDERVRAFLAADDSRGALALLETITKENIRSIDEFDDDGGYVFDSLGRLWAEALLGAAVTAAERKAWARRLETWQETLVDYGMEDGIAVGIAAAEQGWDYPPLVRILRGEITDQSSGDGEPPVGADGLSEVRLAILERQGRHQEYLYLAEAAGLTMLYLPMLVRLGRIAEAIEYWRECEGLQPAHALTMATALRQAGEFEHALEVAEQGLALPVVEQGYLTHGGKAELAVWLRDLATGMGRAEQALAAALVAFQHEMNLANYRGVEELAGEDWPAHRPRLLDQLRGSQSYDYDGRVDIFLREGLIDDAIAVVDQYSYSYDLVRRVVEAALLTRPEWAIDASRRQAEAIMDAGKSQRYHHAADWLTRARSGYLAAGREADWRTYRAALLAQHRRKYSLRPLLEALPE